MSTAGDTGQETRDEPIVSEVGRRAFLGTRRTQPGVFLLLRRLRSPLIVLIVVYAVAVFGFTLIPGVDDQGRPWRMGFFHAFYFVSFLGTTIGLGEIPYPFTDAQRLWALLSIYATVVAWLYGIGAPAGHAAGPAVPAHRAREPRRQRGAPDAGALRAAVRLRRRRHPGGPRTGRGRHARGGGRRARRACRRGGGRRAAPVDAGAARRRGRPVGPDPRRRHAPALHGHAGADRRRPRQPGDRADRQAAEPAARGDLRGAQARRAGRHGQGRRRPHHQPARHLRRTAGGGDAHAQPARDLRGPDHADRQCDGHAAADPEAGAG